MNQKDDDSLPDDDALTEVIESLPEEQRVQLEQITGVKKGVEIARMIRQQIEWNIPILPAKALEDHLPEDRAALIQLWIEFCRAEIDATLIENEAAKVGLGIARNESETNRAMAQRGQLLGAGLALVALVAVVVLAALEQALLGGTVFAGSLFALIALLVRTRVRNHGTSDAPVDPPSTDQPG